MLKITNEVEKVFSVLEKDGFEAFLVGGCVRDALLGKVPSDYDFATNATPDEVIKVFRKNDHIAVPTGIDFGTITVLIGDSEFEITTYREDCLYSDGRRPDSVTFSDTIEEDLSRRDLTINAMAFNPNMGLVDVFGGVYDLSNGIIRSVGCPYDRLREDFLRAFRTIRFSSRLNFKADKSLIEAIRDNSNLVKNVSPNRIKVEIFKTLLSYKDSFEEVNLLGVLLKGVLPELSMLSELRLRELWTMISKSPEDELVRMSILLYSLGNSVEDSVSIANRFMRSLRCSNKEISRVVFLIENQNTEILNDSISIRKNLSMFGKYKLYDMIIFQNSIGIVSYTFSIELFTGITEELNQGNCLTLKELALNGADLISLGVPKGTSVGDMLSYLLSEVLSKPELNTFEQLRNIVIQKVGL